MMGQEETAGERVRAWGMKVLNVRTRKGERVKEEGIEPKELNILSPPQSVTPSLARPSVNQIESRRTGRGLKQNPRGGEIGGRGSWGAGATRGARTWSPSLLTHLPQSPPRLSSAPKCRPSALSRREHGPSIPELRAAHGPRDTSHPRLTSSGHRCSCRSVILAGAPPP